MRTYPFFLLAWPLTRGTSVVDASSNAFVLTADVSSLAPSCDRFSTILKERCRRVLCVKEKLHPALAPSIQNKYRLTLKRAVKTADEVAPASFFLKDTGFTGAENATLVARLLSNHSFAICHLDDGNLPSLTQNVRLLRDEIRLVGDTREPWNPNCQHQRQQYRK